MWCRARPFWMLAANKVSTLWAFLLSTGPLGQLLGSHAQLALPILKFYHRCAVIMFGLFHLLVNSLIVTWLGLHLCAVEITVGLSLPGSVSGLVSVVLSPLLRMMSACARRKMRLITLLVIVDVVVCGSLIASQVLALGFVLFILMLA